MARLVFLGTEFAGRIEIIGEGTTSVGRSPHNGLVIAHKSISAEHCELLVFGTEVIVREKHSTNGTWVDGQRVTGQLPVKVGQVVKLGSIEARLEFEDAERPGDHTEDVTSSWQYSDWVRERSKAPTPAEPAAPEPRRGTEPVAESDVTATITLHAAPPATGAAPPPAPALPSDPARPSSPRRRMAIGSLLVVTLGLIGLWLKACKGH